MIRREVVTPPPRRRRLPGALVSVVMFVVLLAEAGGIAYLAKELEDTDRRQRGASGALRERMLEIEVLVRELYRCASR